MTRHAYSLIAPDGEIHRGKDIKALAKKYSLDRTCLWRVHVGERSHHKGWKADEEFYMGIQL